MSVLGRGAMGTVYRALDPRLQREVALKLLHARISSTTPSEGVTRLRAEAKALARLSHPNVVGVLDIGIHDDQVYVAMELVRGRTLEQWARDVPPNVPNRLERLLAFSIDACLGLEAAHAADILHRDVKPQNLLVGDDGRLRVADFGLALDAPQDEGVGPTQADEVANLRRTASTAGLIAGTPAYMSPEQFEGRTDARSDAFSLCVSLWEAAWGRRPFTGPTIAAVLDAVERGEVRPAKIRGADDRWFAGVLRRGLAARPDDRVATVRELREALEQGPPSARRPWIFWGTLVGSVFAGLAAVASVPRSDTARCEDAAAAMEAVWTDGRRDAVSDVRLREALDAYVEAWSAARREACVANPTPASATTVRCLDRQRERLDTFLATARERGATADAEDIGHWGSPQACSDPRAHAAFALPGDPLAAARIHALERDLMLDSARERLDPSTIALPRAEALVRRARALAHDPSLALALEHLGERLTETNSAAAAERFTEAYQVASRAGMNDSAVRAATSAAVVHTRYTADFDEADRMLRTAEALVPRLSSLETMERVDVLHARAELLGAQGRSDDAAHLLESSLDQTTRPLHEARLRESLSAHLIRLGRYEQARSHAERALALYRATLGPTHPQVMVVLSHLANTWLGRGRGAEARDVLLEAQQIHALLSGDDTPQYAMLDANLGSAYMLLGDKEAAEAAHRRALAIFDASLPEAHPARTQARVIVAGFADAEEAEALLDDALAIAERHFGAESVEAARARAALGRLYQQTERPERAVPLLREAIERYRAFGQPHRAVASQASLALALDVLGQRAEAKAQADEALRAGEDALGTDSTDLVLPLLAAASVERADPVRRKALLERLQALPNAERLHPEEFAAAAALLATGQPSLTAPSGLSARRPPP